jgi:hypothetical protein
MKKLLLATVLTATTLFGFATTVSAASQDPVNINMSLVFTQNELLTK